jgi:hypothetical protein
MVDSSRRHPRLRVAAYHLMKRTRRSCKQPTNFFRKSASAVLDLLRSQICEAGAKMAQHVIVQ